jgi:hypothetical protein
MRKLAFAIAAIATLAFAAPVYADCSGTNCVVAGGCGGGRVNVACGGDA